MNAELHNLGEQLAEPPLPVEEFYNFVFGWPVIRERPLEESFGLNRWEIMRRNGLAYEPLALKPGQAISRIISPYNQTTFTDLGILWVDDIEAIRHKLHSYNGALGYINGDRVFEFESIKVKIAFYEDPSNHFVALQQDPEIPPADLRILHNA
jgi:hypothetical protein